MFSLNTKAPQPVLPGPSTLSGLPATAGATASSGTVNTPDVAGQPSHDIHSTALQNMASGGPSGFQAAGKPYYDSDEWRRTAPALKAACGRQLLALDPTGVAGSDPYLDSPALDALAGHHFPVGTLNALLRYFWGDKTVLRDELVPATRVFIRRLEAEKTALGGVPANIARLNNAIRRDLVAALQQVVHGYADHYLEAMQAARGLPYQQAQVQICTHLQQVQGLLSNPSIAAAVPPTHAASPFADAPRMLLPHADKPPAQVMTDLVATQGVDQAFMDDTARAMQTYFDTFHGLHADMPRLLATLPLTVLIRLANSMVIYTTPTVDAATAERMVFERDLTNVNGISKYSGANRAVLGCEGSYYFSQEARQAGVHRPGKSTAHESRVAMFNPGGSIAYPRMLHLAAVALDFPVQPEFDVYVDPQGSLRLPEYAKQMRAVFSHLKTAVQNERPERVVLSALGAGAFLAGLNWQSQQPRARDVVIDELVASTLFLRSQNIEAVYCEQHQSMPIWAEVNARLAAAGSDPLPWVGSIPGDWVRDGDLILNPADNAGVAGNGCKLDRSFDGEIGTWTTAHPVHALKCFIQNREPDSMTTQF